MKLKDLYIHFLVWLGAEPPPGYEHLLPQAAQMSPPPKPQAEVAPGIPQTPPQPQPVPRPVAVHSAAPATPQPGPAKVYPQPPVKKIYTGEARALYNNLLLKTLHDEQVVERLIRYERERNPRGSDVEILQAGIEHWIHDNQAWL